MSILHPYPTLHEDSLDYTDPYSYVPVLQRVKTEVKITHRLSRGNLVADLVEKQKAAFFCTVAIEGTIFRMTKMVATDQIGEHNAGDLELITYEQKLEIPKFKNAGDVLARPGIVLTEETNIKTAEATGISDFHKENADIHFPAQAIIAFTRWKRLFSLGSLFAIRSNEKQKDGVFKVEISYDQVIKIRIDLSPKTYDAVESKREGTTPHVLCASLSAALRELHHYRNLEDHDEKLQAAEGLKTFLLQKELPTWEDEDFDAAFVASSLYPAALQEASDS